MAGARSGGGMRLGKRVAPPRFVMFGAMFAIGLGAGVPLLGWGRGTMTAFDASAIVFFFSLPPIFARGEAEQMRSAARDNDANRALLLALTGLIMLVILATVVREMHNMGDPFAIALVIATLALAWLFSNTVYALHYAHLFYGDDDADGADNGGLDFPKTERPAYWDFVYFSFTLGMTFQTSDTAITSTRMRVVVVGQSLAAFVFNLGVLAFTINTLGGGK